VPTIAGPVEERLMKKILALIALVRLFR